MALLTCLPAAAEPACGNDPVPAGEWDRIEAYIRSNYAYLDRVADPDSLLSRAAADAARASTVAELGTSVERLGYVFRDSHFHVSPVAQPPRAWIPSAADIVVQLDENGHYNIVDVKQNSAAHDADIRPGWRLVAIDDLAIDTAIAALLDPLEAAPDAATRSYAANVLAAGLLNTPRSLTFMTSDGERRVSLPAGYASVRRPSEPVSVRRIGDITLIRLNNQLGNNDAIALFDAALTDAFNARAIILDLRDTPSGGNTTVARAIIGHFIQTTEPYQRHVNAFEQRQFGVPRESIELVHPRLPYFAGQVVVLAGRWTGSVGEAVAIGMDAATPHASVGTGLADLLGTLNSATPGQSCLTLSLAWDRLDHANGQRREDWLPSHILPSGDTDPAGEDPSLTTALVLLAQPTN